MASLIARIRAFARSPQGQRAIGKARQAAADPRNQAKARRLLSRVRSRR